MKAPHSLHMGPAPAAAPIATKFWNVASVSEDEGEITLYGDVMSQQPIDWWTGEPEPGLYITPEGFMEDLAAVKDKAHILNFEKQKLDTLLGIGALIGTPTVEFLESANPTSDMMNGDFVWDISATPTPPFKSGTVRVCYTDEGFQSFFESE